MTAPATQGGAQGARVVESAARASARRVNGASVARASARRVAPGRVLLMAMVARTAAALNLWSDHRGPMPAAARRKRDAAAAAVLVNRDALVFSEDGFFPELLVDPRTAFLLRATWSARAPGYLSESLANFESGLVVGYRRSSRTGPIRTSSSGRTSSRATRGRSASGASSTRACRRKRRG